MFPQRLKTGGTTYKVRVVKEIDNNGDILGGLDMESNIICIKKCNPAVMQATLCHEVIHTWNSQLPEDVVDWFALSLFSFIKRNKKLVRHLIDN